MTQKLYLAVTLVLAFMAVGHAADSELTRLKQAYDEASTRVLTPIKATYERELAKLLDKQTKAGKLTEAVETKAELDHLKSDGQKTGGSLEADWKSTLEKLFVGRTWQTALGTTFELKKNGTGIKQIGSNKTPIAWRLVDPDVVEVSGEKDASGQVPLWFLRFVSREEAYIGATKNLTDGKLTSK